ncbi:MAG: ProQ/FINO family protein, partial [Halomonas sp.]|uniref:ProQ/FINO family protein n=1 Tax=Halomonas sp. TaxID=1486246 RepID=UPI003F91627A
PVKQEPVKQEPVKQEPVKQEPVKQEPAETPAPSPQALLKEWYKRYDRAFFKGHTLPLKVGIHEDLAAAEPWPEKLVRRALACYVNLPRYLKAMRNDAGRIDLQGQPAGSVDQGAADHAQRKLERLQAERRSSQGAAKARAKTSASAEAKAKQGSDAEAGKGATKEKDTSQKAAKGKAKHRAKGGVAEKSRKNAPRGPGKHRQADAGRGDKRERDVLPDDPAKRMQLKLDALMARHTKHDTKQ